MNKAIITIMTAVLFAASSTTNAEIVFDNGEPSIFTEVGNDVLGRLQVDDFVLTQDIFLRGAHFWTREENAFAWDNTLEYFILVDDNGTPGTVISSGDGQNVQKNATGEETPGSVEYEYSFEFETPVSMLTDNLYWFGLHLASGYPSDALWHIWWSPSVAGFGSTSFESEGGTLDNWSDTGIHRAFYLEGIPEPGTIFLFGVGDLAIVTRIRQRT